MNKFLEKYIKDEKIRKYADYLITALLCVIIFFGVRMFIAIPVQADGISMYPTVDNKDVVLVNKLAYLFKDPEYQDIIIFPYDDNEVYIKRVIGMPGDEIDMKDGYLYINGEKYVDEYGGILMAYGDREYPITLEEDMYYVLGDNRDVSKDSRYSSVGDISKDEIIGKAVFTYFPFKNFKVLN